MNVFRIFLRQSLPYRWAPVRTRASACKNVRACTNTRVHVRARARMCKRVRAFASTCEHMRTRASVSKHVRACASMCEHARAFASTCEHVRAAGVISRRGVSDRPRRSNASKSGRKIQKWSARGPVGRKRVNAFKSGRKNPKVVGSRSGGSKTLKRL